ncbi:hypothetical protein GWI33_005249, partial [Rhynchophorus ferrugineus]
MEDLLTCSAQLLEGASHHRQRSRKRVRTREFIGQEHDPEDEKVFPEHGGRRRLFGGAFPTVLGPVFSVVSSVKTVGTMRLSDYKLRAWFQLLFVASSLK